MIPPDPALTFTPCRAAGLARWATFLPEAGRRYAERRNFDGGPGHRANVSALSPWIRHRLVREDKVVAAALARHGDLVAEKFIQEVVVWRTYWKGWLEQRPAVWTRYRAAVAAGLHALEREPGMARGPACSTRPRRHHPDRPAPGVGRCPVALGHPGLFSVQGTSAGRPAAAGPRRPPGRRLSVG